MGFNDSLDNYTGTAPKGTQFADPGTFVFGGKAGKWHGTGYDDEGAREQAAAAFARAQQADRTNAPSFDWSQLEADQANAAAMRREQGQGLDLYAQAADTSRGSAASEALLAQSRAALGAQRAIAGGARGGALGALAARRAVDAGAAAWGQQAQGQALQLRAGEAAQARQAYAQGTSDLRAGDARAVGLGLSRAGAEAENELRQRDLNAQREAGLNRLGFDVQAAALQGRLGDADFNRRRLDAYNAVASGDAEAQARSRGQALGAAGTAISGIGQIVGQAAGGRGGSGSSEDDDDPYAGGR